MKTEGGRWKGLRPSTFCLLPSTLTLPPSIVILLLVIYPLCGFCADGPKVPFLFTEQPTVDVGTLVEGKTIRHTFFLQNKGDAPLIIQRVDKDCACTKVSHDELILPGRNSYLNVVIDTAGQTGSWTRTLRIFSNDPLAPEAVLTIKARVLQAVRVEPDRVFFNGIAGHHLDQTVRITAPDEKAFSLELKASRLPDQVGFRIQPQKTHYLIHIRHKGLKPETSRGRIFLSTDIPHRPLITIPVFSRIQDPSGIRFFPSRIDFGSLRKKGPCLTRSVNLRYPGDAPPALEIFGPDQDRFATRIIPLDRVSTIRIEITPLLNQFSPGKYDTRLEIRLKDQKQKLEIPLQIKIL